MPVIPQMQAVHKPKGEKMVSITEKLYLRIKKDHPEYFL